MTEEEIKKEYDKLYYKDKVLVDSMPTFNDDPNAWYSWYISLKKRLGKTKAALIFAQLYSKTGYKNNDNNAKLVELMKSENIDLGDSNWYLRMKQSLGIGDYLTDVKSFMLSIIGISALGGGLYLGFKYLSKKV